MDTIPRFRVFFTGPKPPEDYLQSLKPFGPTSTQRDAVGVAYFGGVKDMSQAVQDAVDEIREKVPELRLTFWERWGN